MEMRSSKVEQGERDWRERQDLGLQAECHTREFGPAGSRGGREGQCTVATCLDVCSEVSRRLFAGRVWKGHDQRQGGPQSLEQCTPAPQRKLLALPRG